MWPLVFLALASCGAYDSAKSGVKRVAGSVAGELAELTICHLEAVECGHVFECTGTRTNTPSGFPEICISDDRPEQFDEIEDAFGDCEPTPRHQGLCHWHCDGGRGCNAFLGCWGCP